jgi:DNA integrity scanning protein DisA with diadenylate cyclase activity/mannitol/fructose-specific phosphotransferase system IIA component (Ntr-type)
MRIDRYIAQNRVIDIESHDFKGALEELLDVCELPKATRIKKSDLMDELLDRETQMTTYLGNGVCLPHARVKMKRPYMIAVGRCPKGLEFKGQRDYPEIRYLFLLLAAENARSYLYGLAALARVFQDNAQMALLASAQSLTEFKRELKSVFGGQGRTTIQGHNRFNFLMLKEAAKIAKGSNCSSVVVFGDTFGGGIEIGDLFNGFKTVLIAHGSSEAIKLKDKIDAVLPVRAYSQQRLSQLRSAVLIGLARGVFKSTDRLCCIGGIPQSNQFDCVVVVDIDREFRSLLINRSDVLPSNVLPEVVERVLGIATELAMEGREGHSVGCLFTIGSADKINQYTKPLILNPFHGYDEEDRNILNPFMDETVKELSTIDGAFVIRDDGVLLSAGSLIHAPDYKHRLPSGYGSRHAAAAAITSVVDCLCVVVSSSTGQVSLFRKGEMLPLIEKSFVQR